MLLLYKWEGGLLQLIASGEQDIYLTGNPQLLSLRLFIEDITLFQLNVLNKQ